MLEIIVTWPSARELREDNQWLREPQDRSLLDSNRSLRYSLLPWIAVLGDQLARPQKVAREGMVTWEKELQLLLYVHAIAED